MAAKRRRNGREKKLWAARKVQGLLRSYMIDNRPLLTDSEMTELNREWVVLNDRITKLEKS